MTALLLVACVGMITGAFFIFRISPMDFTLGVFRRLTTGPKSIRDDINETTQRKKPGFFRREIMETQTILQATGKEQKFPTLCAASLLLFAIGAGIAIVMNNFLLVPGVGAQGGSVEEVARYGFNSRCGLLVNSSRGIIYAGGGDEFAEAAADAARRLQGKMREKFL